MNKQELINYINDYLKITEFQDSSKNGLQVDSIKNEIKKIGYAVDATSYIINKAISENVDLLLVHHGLYWGFEQVLVGVPFERVKKLIENNIALAAYHLPLDAHEEVGNNEGLLKEFVEIFDIKDYERESIIEYKWNKIWFWIKFKDKIKVSNLDKYFEKSVVQNNFYNFWNLEYISSVAFCSGGAGMEVKEAKQLWYDLYITWEAVHHEITFAKELKQSVIYGGHYETETFWPKLLAQHLQEKFGLDIVFLDEKY